MTPEYLYSLTLSQVIELYVTIQISTEDFRNYRIRNGIKQTDYDWMAVATQKMNNLMGD